MPSMERFLRTDTCNKKHAAIHHDLFWPLHILHVWQVETISKLPNSNSCKATDRSLSSQRFGRFVADQCRSRIVPKNSFLGSESKGKIEIMLSYLILFLLLKGGRIALQGQIDRVESADMHFHALAHRSVHHFAYYPLFLNHFFR
jgi:hypothetical protein